MIQNLEVDMLSGLSYSAVKPMVDYKNRLENGESAFDTTMMQDKEIVLSILNSQLQRHKIVVDNLIKERPIMGFNFSRLNAQNALKGFTQP